MKLNFLKLGARLRNKLLIGIALASLIPFAAAAVFALYLINSAHNDDIARIEGNLINEKKAEVQNAVDDSISQLAVVLPLPNDYLVRYLRPTESVTGVPVATLPDGRRVAYGINPPSQLDDVLAGELAADPSFKELYFADLGTGLEIAYRANATSSPYDGHPFLDLSHLPQFSAIAEGKQNYVGPVEFTLGGPVVEVAAPVTNASGTAIGVLAGELDLSAIGKTLARTTLGEKGYLYLVDGNGTVLYNSDPSKTDPSGVPTHIAARIAPGRTQAFYRSAWGEDVIGASAAVSVPGQSWELVAEWPVSDANQVINTLEAEFLIFLLVVAMLAVFVSVFFANRIAAPVGMLTAGTARIAAGSFDTPVEITTRDELEDLGTAFNEMMVGLKRLQELKDEFVFVAAHELRTPVAAIKGYLELLENGQVGSVDDNAKAFLRKTIDANSRLIQLVNDLLQVARSDAGRLTIQVAPVDIAPAISSTLDELKPLADQKRIAMIFAPEGVVPQILADVGRVKEVLVNLVGNAIKYSPEGAKVTIATAVQPALQGKRSLIVSVTDNGFGISKESQAKLFSKFYRVQTDKTKDIQGTGLGLFIVKQIVEKMGGVIWVESEEGKGSTFSFSLPLA